MDKKHAIVIGISGGTGSGKTTLAKKLKDFFGEDVVFLCQDYYYKCLDHLPFEERVKQNFDHPDSFDTSLLIDHLKQLKKFKAIERPQYSFVEHTRLKETIIEQPKKVIVLEGILLFENIKLVNEMDIKVYVDTDADIRLARRLIRDIKSRGRDIDSVIDQYFSTVKPMHEAFIEPNKKRADIIIPEGGMNQVAISMLIEKINSILKS